MFTDSRLMAVVIKFWQCQKISHSILQCDYPYTMNVKLCPFYKTSYEQN